MGYIMLSDKDLADAPIHKWPEEVNGAQTTMAGSNPARLERVILPPSLQKEYEQAWHDVLRVARQKMGERAFRDMGLSEDAPPIFTQGHNLAPNAFARITKEGRHYIFANDTFLKLMDKEHIDPVLLHEMGHIALNHVTVLEALKKARPDDIIDRKKQIESEADRIAGV
jgi:Zn-dependent protease with chaperone function